MVYPFILNGIIILYVSVVGGYAFAKAIKSEPEREVAWRVVHSGGSIAGVMLIALGAGWNFIKLDVFEKTIGWSLIVSTYLMIAGMFLAAMTGKRGLHSSSKGIEKIIYLLYASGGVLCTLALTALLIGVIIQ